MQTLLQCAAILCVIIIGVSSLSVQEAGQFFNSRRFGGSVTIADNGESFVITSNGLPDHAIQMTNAYTPLPRNNVLNIPKNPEITEITGCLPRGPVGMTKTGVMIYNPLNIQGENAVEGPATEPIDACKGSVNSLGMYLYRQNSVGCLYNGREDEFLGVAFDGFPIYGPFASDLGREVTNEDLDNCHGRLVNGEYRYHVNNEFPYYLGCFKGDIPRRMDVFSGCNETSEYDEQWGYLCSCQRKSVRFPVGLTQQGQGIGAQGQAVQPQIGNGIPMTEENILLLRQQELQRLQQLRGQLNGRLAQAPGMIPVVSLRNGQIQRQLQPTMMPGSITPTAGQAQRQFVQGPFGRRIDPNTITAGLQGEQGIAVVNGEPQRPLSNGNVIGTTDPSQDGLIQGPFGRRIAPNAISTGLPGSGAATLAVDGEAPRRFSSENADSVELQPGQMIGPFGRIINSNVVSAGTPGFIGGAGTETVDGEMQQPLSSGNVGPGEQQTGQVIGPFGRRIDPNVVSAGTPGFIGVAGTETVDGGMQKPLSSGNVGPGEQQTGQVIGPFGRRIDPNVVSAGTPGFIGGAGTETVGGGMQQPLSSGNIGSVGQTGQVIGPFGRRIDPNVVSAGTPGFIGGAGTETVDGGMQQPLSSGNIGSVGQTGQVIGPFGRRIDPNVVSAGTPGFIGGAGTETVDGGIQQQLSSGNVGSVEQQTGQVMGPFGRRVTFNAVNTGLPGFNRRGRIAVDRELQRRMSSGNIGPIGPQSGTVQFGRRMNFNVIRAGLPSFNGGVGNGEPQPPLSGGMNRGAQGAMVNGVPVIGMGLQQPQVGTVPRRVQPVNGNIVNAGQTAPVMGPPLKDGGFQNVGVPVAFLNENNGRKSPDTPLSPIVGPEAGARLSGPAPPVPKPSPPPADSGISVISNNDGQTPNIVIDDGPISFRAGQGNTGEEFQSTSGFSLRGLRERALGGKNMSEKGPYREYKWFNLYL